MARTIYVIDDDADVLASVCAVLRASGYESIGYISADAFFRGADIQVPGVVVTDLHMPHQNGLEVQQKLVERKSVLSVIVLTGRADVRTTVQVMQQGAVTLLEKPYETAELIAAIDKGLQASDDLAASRQRTKLAQEKLALLTEEERAVMDRALDGLANKQISSALELSMRTVERRRQNAMQKLQIESVGEYALLVTEARRGSNPGEAPASEG